MLKLKSELLSSVLDGTTVGDFRIDNKDDGSNAQLYISKFKNKKKVEFQLKSMNKFQIKHKLYQKKKMFQKKMEQKLDNEI